MHADKESLSLKFVKTPKASKLVGYVSTTYSLDIVIGDDFYGNEKHYEYKVVYISTVSHWTESTKVQKETLKRKEYMKFGVTGDDKN